MIKSKEMSLKSMHNCIVEAGNTYEQYWTEHQENDMSLDDMWNLIDALRSNLEKLDFDDLHEDNICSIGKTPLHNQVYDLENGELPLKAYEGVLVIVEDKESGRSLIIDGNHRYNTFLIHCPDQAVYYFIIESKLP